MPDVVNFSASNPLRLNKPDESAPIKAIGMTDMTSRKEEFFIEVSGIMAFVLIL